MMEELIKDYLNGPEQLRKTIAGMSSDDLRSRPIEGKWSTHEIICHLADFEIINADRIKRIIAEDQPPLRNADPDPFAASLAYDARDSEQELNLIENLRAHVAVILRTLSSDQWNRTGFHSTDGPLTLTQLLKRVTKHIPHHLPFIEEKKKALGKA